MIHGRVDIRVLTEMQKKLSDEARTRFMGCPLIVDEELEDNQWYVGVSQKIYNEIVKEAQNGK